MRLHFAGSLLGLGFQAYPTIRGRFVTAVQGTLYFRTLRVASCVYFEGGWRFRMLVISYSVGNYQQLAGHARHRWSYKDWIELPHISLKIHRTICSSTCTVSTVSFSIQPASIPINIFSEHISIHTLLAPFHSLFNFSQSKYVQPSTNIQKGTY